MVDDSPLRAFQTSHQQITGEYQYLLLLDEIVPKRLVDNSIDNSVLQLAHLSKHAVWITCMSDDPADVWGLLGLNTNDHPGAVLGLDGSCSVSGDSQLIEWFMDRFRQDQQRSP